MPVPWNNLTTSSNSLWTSGTASYAYTLSDFGAVTVQATSKPREGNDLDWLDDRVNEMRVKL